MINIIDKSKCCGCNACIQCCPKQCITMHEDKEGFLYPKVDHAICIDCGMCEKVCPVIHQNESKQPLKVYAAKNSNEAQRLRSSSGGVFILLAEQIIKQGGVVFGARFDKNWEVEHCYVETFEELEPLMRSKYVQSRIGNTYKEAEQFLKQGRQVLFVGTSCQIAGLKKFLRKEYDNLLAVDFICHGVPSPGVWRKYMEEIKTSQSEVAGKNMISLLSLKTIPVITSVNFREKQLGGYSWKKYGFVVHQKSSFKGDQNTVLLSTKFSRDAYMKGFLQNYYLRLSCFACPAKSGKSGSDLTIADYWGVHLYYPMLDDDKGTSAIFVQTQKGLDVVKRISGLFLFESTFEEATSNNQAYYASYPVPPLRMKFWELYKRNNKTLREIYNNTSKISFLQRVKNSIHYRLIILYHKALNK